MVKKQKGFVGIHLLLVAAVVLVVGVAGYLVWHSHQNSAQPNAANFTWR